MSRTILRKPEFRLLLGYPIVTLMREQATEPIGTVSSDAPGFALELRRLVGIVARARGRLTVVLPEAEVWRGPLSAEGGRRARQGAARTLAAAALGVPPADLAVVVAPSGTAAAATRRATLAETRRLLGGAELRAATITGAGAFEGFAAPPQLDVRAPLLPSAALGAGALAAAAAALWLALPPEAPAPVAVAPAAAPVPAVVAEARPAPEPVRAVPLAPLHASRPPARPVAVAALPAPVVQASRNVDLLWVAPARGGAPELRLAELTTARARMTDAGTTVAAPMHRPAPVVVAAVPVAAPAPAPAPVAARAATDAVAELRPRPRPGLAARAAAALPVAAASSTTASDFGRPRPRPGEEPAVKVASLAPEAATIAGLVAAGAVLTPPPPARPDGLRARPAAAPVVVRPTRAEVPKPVTKPVAKPVAAPVAPARVVTAAPQPQRVAAIAPQRVVTAAPKAVATQRVVTAAPKAVAPKPVAAKPVAPKPVAAVPRKVVPVASLDKAFSGPVREGISRREVSLIGIFGGADGRHALLRLPNGRIERVRAGDSVQGVKVAAVGTDTVQISGRGRNTLLRLPD